MESGGVEDVATDGGTSNGVTSRLQAINAAAERRVIIQLDSSASQSPALSRFYSFRYVLDGSDDARLAAAHFIEIATRHDRYFISTRGSRSGSSTTTQQEEDDDGGDVPAVRSATFLSVVRDGLAADGGLFCPIADILIPISQVKFLATAAELSYQDVAQTVLEFICDRSEVPPGVLSQFLHESYHPTRWQSSLVAPVTPLLIAADSTTATRAFGQELYLLELYHGPTAAFKDFALQLFPLFFSLSTLGSQQKFAILAATSGDTGVAAISGFAKSSPDTKVMVLFPEDGVSPVQKVQMLSYHNNLTVKVVGVDSDFDFCQSTVKSIFSDTALASKITAEQQTSLSSANSINWGRLAPQIVYYFFAYRQLVQRGALAFGDPMDVAVPSGNFGNILSCFIAKKMGLPVGKMILASNANDVLYEFIQTGRYDVRSRSLHVTASPSIDILKASNVERFLYYLSGGCTGLVADLMNQLDKEKHFELPADLVEKIKNDFWAMKCSEEECAETIRNVFTESHGQRIVDPHTSVAVFAAAAYRRADPASKSRPLVIASTAHWAKFPEPVLRSLDPKNEALVAPSGSTPTEHVKTLHEAVLKLCPAEQVHGALQTALQQPPSAAPSRSPKDAAFIKNMLLEFLATHKK